MYKSPIWLAFNQADRIAHSHLKRPIKQALKQMSLDYAHLP